MNYEETFMRNRDINQYNFCNLHYVSNNQAGRIVSKHCHAFYEINMNLDGYSIEQIGNKVLKVPAYAVAFIEPLEIHSFLGGTMEENLVFQYTPRYFRNLLTNTSEHAFLKKTGTLKEKGFYQLKEGTEAWECMQKLIALTTVVKAGDSVKSQAEDIVHEFKEAFALLAFIVALINENQLQLTTKETYAGDIADYSRLVSKILANPEIRITLQEAADFCNVSYSQFSRDFKKNFGKGYVEFVNMIRINRAKELLKNKAFTIRDVAEQLNFGSEFYFSRMYKNSTGESPSDYRKSICQ